MGAKKEQERGADACIKIYSQVGRKGFSKDFKIEHTEKFGYKAREWLDWIAHSQTISIQHKFNSKEKQGNVVSEMMVIMQEIQQHYINSTGALGMVVDVVQHLLITT